MNNSYVTIKYNTTTTQNTSELIRPMHASSQLRHSCRRPVSLQLTMLVTGNKQTHAKPTSTHSALADGSASTSSFVLDTARFCSHWTHHITPPS